jgi:hypothetical protein
MKRTSFRSGIERDLSKQLRNNSVPFEYEPADKKIPYTVPAAKCSYLPDFYITTKTGKTIIIEAKGRWVYEDRFKHLLIRQQHPHLDIRFVFCNSKSRIRKGSKTTYRDICNGKGRGVFKGITWKYADKKIPKEWWNE